MRKRIEQLLNGSFEYQTKPLVLPEEKLELRAKADSILSGFFVVSSSDEKKVKGFLYSSNPRFTFDPPQFYASSVRIYYQVDTSGLSAGSCSEGAFTICSERGEYSLPYAIHIEAEGREKSDETASGIALGEDFSLEGMAEAAREDMEQVQRLFLSDAFAQYLKNTDEERYILYRSLQPEKHPLQSMEEFFIHCSLKEPVHVALEQSSVVLPPPGQTQRHQVMLKVDHWGYAQIDISSDATFLRPEKKKMTTLEFTGGVYALEYVIDKNFLHKGKNCGRMIIRAGSEVLALDVVVESRNTGSERIRQSRVRKLMRKQLLTLYLDLRMKRIDTQHWIDRSNSVLASYRRAGGKDVFADLLQIQLYYADGKKMRASSMLSSLEKTPARFKTKEQYAFYLYLSTFFQRSSEYVDQVERSIEQMFLSCKDSWIIAWILLYLQPRYLKDDNARMEALDNQYVMGCASPVMYIESMQLVRKNPYLLRNLSEHHRNFLYFGAKNHLITEELSFQIASLIMNEGTFDRIWLAILEECYRVNDSSEILTAVITMLIRGNCRKKEFFPWYARGVDRELRITGLYEYYMETMDTVGIEKMPQIIRMYFSYDTTLNYHKKAAIYRDISDNRDSIPLAYQGARTGIESFVSQQLALDRIDRNLAILYERFLSRKMLGTSLAQHLVKLLFTWSVTCKNPAMRSVIVVHPCLRREQEILLKNGKAKVQMYTSDAILLLADEQGNRYVPSSLCKTERYMDSPLLLTYCKELIPTHPGLVLHMCRQEKETTREMLPYLKTAEKMDDLTDAFRMDIRGRILQYYLANPREDDLYSYLKSVSYQDFIRADKKALLSVLTREGLYEDAFSLLEQYGSEEIDLTHLVRICSQSVLGLEYDENTVLLSYCDQCFQYGKYDDNILTYLLMYYEGPIEEMKRLWNTGHQNEMDTMILEEKILSMLLFTRSGSGGTEQIYASYQHKLGRKKLCTAYINLKAYEYFVKNLPVNDLIFDAIEQTLLKQKQADDVCKLALLQYYAFSGSLDPRQEELIRSLLGDYDREGIRFRFYREFPERIRYPLQLEDKVFMEYVADPSHQAILFYRMKGEEEYHSEPMKNCFEGIFVREFILFSSEEIECYVEEYEGETLVATSQVRTMSSEAMMDEGSRYSQINHMLLHEKEGNEEKLLSDLDNYFQTEYIMSKIFTLI
ncbi:MAG: hypothetical protein IJI24_09390 [Lachnospiraceae bacterium]|nr:hypothetical protein [Lachnospiraceae bacterium]